MNPAVIFSVFVLSSLLGLVLPSMAAIAGQGLKGEAVTKLTPVLVALGILALSLACFLGFALLQN